MQNGVLTLLLFLIQVHGNNNIVTVLFMGCTVVLVIDSPAFEIKI